MSQPDIIGLFIIREVWSESSLSILISVAKASRISRSDCNKNILMRLSCLPTLLRTFRSVPSTCDCCLKVYGLIEHQVSNHCLLTAITAYWQQSLLTVSSTCKSRKRHCWRGDDVTCGSEQWLTTARLIHFTEDHVSFIRDKHRLK